MYNINSTSYSEDNRNLYLAIGIASLSLISYSKTNTVIELSSPTYVQVEKVNDEDFELTNHAMNLAQTSLGEDWDSENDEHWEAFL